MAEFKRALDLYKKQIARLEAANADLKKGHSMLASQGLGDLRQLTEGPLKTKTLRKMGHPFARRHEVAAAAKSKAETGVGSGRKRGSKPGFSKAPNLPLNKQSGALRASMVNRKRSAESPIVQSFGVGPGSEKPYFKFILAKAGTRKMVARGFSIEVRNRWTLRNRALLDHVRKTASKP